jgi:hypothetical protein
MLYKGFEHPPAMGIPYNYEYYNHLMSQLEFEKEMDFTSFYLNYDELLDVKALERIRRVAEWVRKRHDLHVKTFSSKAEVRRWVPLVVELYNKIFVENWEFVPVTPEEAEEVAGRMLQIVQPEHIKLIVAREDKVVGFLLTFLNVSAALQRTGGKLFPFGWITLLRELKRTKLVDINGMGLLEEYRGLGGNAILYDELEKTLNRGGFEHADLVQMADTVPRMIADVTKFGAKPYKVHRVYQKSI